MAETQAEGVVRFKKEGQVRGEVIQEYGFLDGEWVVLMLQLANKGSARKFV